MRTRQISKKFLANVYTQFTDCFPRECNADDHIIDDNVACTYFMTVHTGPRSHSFVIQFGLKGNIWIGSFHASRQPH